MTHEPAVHASIDEAGQCAACRARAVELLRDLPCRYLLSFPGGGQGSFAIVPAIDFDGAVTAAWATGCNAGGQVAGMEVDAADVDRAAIPICTLLTGPAAVAALDAFRAATR
jgi:hypothetical protein